jgi:hypothetical protein
MDSAKAALLEAAGGDAAATVVFYPRHWSTFSSALLRLGGSLIPGDVRPILEATGLWEAVRRFAAEERLDLPRSLDGWDDSRPIVFALFEPSELSVTELIARTEERNPAQLISHRVVVPASDPAALMRAFVQMAHEAECIDTPREELGEDVPDDPSVVCGGILVVFEAADAHLRIRIAELREPVAIPEAITRTLDSPIVMTPALRWTFDGPVVLAAHVRPAKLRAALLLFMAEEVGRMAGYSSGDSDHARRVARGKADLIGAILRTSPVGIEVDDMALGMTTGNLPTFAVVHGLTEVGVAAYDAGIDAPVPAEGPGNAPFVVRSRVNVDVMQAVAGVPLGLAGARSPDAALERVEACGEACYLHMLTSRVYGLGALSDETGLLRDLENDAGAFFRFEPAELADDVMMELVLDFPGLGQRLGGDRQTTEITDAIGVARAVQVRQGRTVMTTLRLGGAPPHPDPGPFVADDPGPIGNARPRDEGAACVEAAIVGYERLLVNRSARDAGASGCPEAPEELRALITAWEEIAPAFR